MIVYNTDAHRAAENIVLRMKKLTDNKFTFEYKLTNDGIEFYSADYFDYVNKGVEGIKSGKSKAGYKYKAPYDIPASAFSKYTSDRSAQFAIARSVENKGIKAQDYTEKFDKDKSIIDSLQIIYLQVVDYNIKKSLK